MLAESEAWIDRCANVGMKHSLDVEERGMVCEQGSYSKGVLVIPLKKGHSDTASQASNEPQSNFHSQGCLHLEYFT